MRRWLTDYRCQFWAIWLLCAVFLFCMILPQAMRWQMGDADDQLRLLQVRDFLSGQSWFDVSQHRMNPPFGGPMHWSRLVDIPLIIIIGALTPIAGQAQAEWLGAIIVPMLTYASLSWLLGTIARTWWGNAAGLVAGLLPILSVPILVQVAPMRIDHHGWQMVLFLICCHMLQRPASQRTGVITGVSLALWLTISIEGLPFAALFCAIAAARWLKAEAARGALVAQLASLTGSMAGLFLATRWLFDLRSYCDAVSPFHIAAIGAASLVVAAGARFADRAPQHLRVAARCGLLALAALAALAIVRWQAPLCLGDAFVQLDPLVRRFWFERTEEGLSVWMVPGQTQRLIFLLVVAVPGAVWLALQHGNRALAGRFAMLAAMIFGFAVGSAVLRAMVYPSLILIVLVAGMVVWLFKRSGQMQSGALRVALRVAGLLALMPGIPEFAFALATPAPPTNIQQNKAAGNSKQLDCKGYRTINKLNALPAAQLMAPLDVSPGILQHSHHHVVATGHHRNQMAMRDVILSFTSSPEAVRAIFVKRGIEYLAVCPDAAELKVYELYAPQGFWAQLRAGTVPDWLKAQGDIGSYKIWAFAPGTAK